MQVELARALTVSELGIRGCRAMANTQQARRNSRCLSDDCDAALQAIHRELPFTNSQWKRTRLVLYHDKLTSFDSEVPPRLDNSQAVDRQGPHAWLRHFDQVQHETLSISSF